MVLVLNGVLQDECPLDTNSLFLQHPVYRDYANQLTSIPQRTVGPVGLLFVGQREMAAVSPHDKNVNTIGSDDATSCIIVVVRHSGKFTLITIIMSLLLKASLYYRFRCCGFSAYGRARHR